MKKKTARILAVLPAALLALSACGGDNNANDPFQAVCGQILPGDGGFNSPANRLNYIFGRLVRPIW